MNTSIKLLIVDDHPIFREGLRTLIQRFPDLEVLGEASTGKRAIQLLGTLRPDVVLLDIRLPDVTGLQLLHTIRQMQPATRIIVLSMHDSEGYLVEALQAGANGYLLKGQEPELIPRAIYTVMEGGAVVEGDLLLRAVGRLTPATGAIAADLSAREITVLTLLAQGSSNRRIAEEMSLAEITIKKHIQSLMQKMGTSDRTQTALKAVRMRLVD